MDIDFQKIMEFLEKIIPKGWSRIVFLAEYTSGSYSMKYYVDMGQNGYIDCYKVQGITKTALIKEFKNIDKILSPVRKELSDNNLWYAFTMIVDSEGSFRTEFDYNNHEGNTLEFIENWEKNYLK